MSLKWDPNTFRPKLSKEETALADEYLRKFEQKLQDAGSLEEMIKRCKDAMLEHKGTLEGDDAAMQLLAVLLNAYDLPDPESGVVFARAGNSVQWMEWDTFRSAQIEAVISSTTPTVKVTLGKSDDKDCRVLDSLTYEDAMEELYIWFRAVD